MFKNKELKKMNIMACISKMVYDCSGVRKQGGVRRQNEAKGVQGKREVGSKIRSWSRSSWTASL